MTDDLLVEHRDSIATLTLNRPQSHNAINMGMYKAIPDLVAELDKDPAVKVVVVRGGKPEDVMVKMGRSRD